MAHTVVVSVTLVFSAEKTPLECSEPESSIGLTVIAVVSATSLSSFQAYPMECSESESNLLETGCGGISGFLQPSRECSIRVMRVREQHLLARVVVVSATLLQFCG